MIIVLDSPTVFYELEANDQNIIIHPPVGFKDFKGKTVNELFNKISKLHEWLCRNDNSRVVPMMGHKPSPLRKRGESPCRTEEIAQRLSRSKKI